MIHESSDTRTNEQREGELKTGSADQAVRAASHEERDSGSQQYCGHNRESGHSFCVRRIAKVNVGNTMIARIMEV